MPGPARNAHLAVLPLPLAITGLDDELCGEDVGQLGSIAVAPTSHLQRRQAKLMPAMQVSILQLLMECVNPYKVIKCQRIERVAAGI